MTTIKTLLVMSEDEREQYIGRMVEHIDFKKKYKQIKALMLGAKADRYRNLIEIQSHLEKFDPQYH